MEKIEECLAILRELGPEYLKQTSYPLVVLGRVVASQGKFQEAREFLLEALEALKSQEYTYGLATCLEAVCALPGISPDRAARFLGKAKALREKEGFGIPISERHLVEPIVENLQSKLGKESFDLATTEGTTLSYEKTIEEATEALKSIM